MVKLLLIVCTVVACGLGPAYGQTADLQTVPPARLIKPRTGHAETHPVVRAHPHPRPLDARCRPLKEQLELALQKPGNSHRQFQARVARNAGTRLCREGHADKGIAEFERGLSYLQDAPHS